MALLLAVLQPRALVVLQHPMLAAKVPLAEGAVSYDALGRFFAVFVRAADFLRCATLARCYYVESGGRRDGERFQGGSDVGCGGKVLACMNETEVGRGNRGAEREELTEGGYRCVWGNIEGDSYEIVISGGVPMLLVSGKP